MRLRKRMYTVLVSISHHSLAGGPLTWQKQISIKSQDDIVSQSDSGQKFTLIGDWNSDICSCLLHRTLLLLVLLQAITWPVGVFSVNYCLSGLFKHHQWRRKRWFLPFIFPPEPQKTGMKVLFLQANN